MVDVEGPATARGAAGAARRRATVRDVAAAAGVSKATAGRVLGDYGPVSDEVRTRVQEAAARLGYRPNGLARSVATGQSHTIGAIVSDIENPFFGRVARGITDVASPAGFDLVLSNADERLERERALVDVLLNKRVDGLVIAPASSVDVAHLQRLDRSGTPFVLVDRVADPIACDTVTVDNRGGAAALGTAIARHGHRRVTFVSSLVAPDWTEDAPLPTSTVRERVDGLRDVLGGGSALHVRLAATSHDEVERIVTEELARDDPPTALVASDSLIALSMLRVLQERAVWVPDDVSLASFDDADWTSVTTPPLTVVDQPMYEVGERAARLLLDRIRGGSGEPVHEVLGTRLVERASLAAPRA